MEKKTLHIPFLKDIWMMIGSLQESTDLLGLLENALKQTIELCNAEAGTFWLFMKEDQQAFPLVAIGPNSQALSGLRLNRGEGIAGWVIENSESIIVEDTQNDPKWSSRFDQHSGFKTKSLICYPVTSNDICIGCIQLINKKDNSYFNHDDLALCSNLGLVIGYALEKNGFLLNSIPAAQIVFSVKNILKSYSSGENKIIALNNISLDIFKGELLVILGASGSGKSTLLNILGGIDTPDNGEVWSGKTNLSKAGDKLLTKYRRHDVGFVFQSYNLIPDLTAYENVALAAELAKDPLPIKEALDAVELLHRANHFPNQLSGGEQQRVSIARALVKQPRILLCDEPTGALDHLTGKKVLGIIEKLSRELGHTVIIVTHNNAIGAVADRVVRMRSGNIIELSRNPKPVSAEGIEL